MSTTLTTTVTELPESRVRVEAEVAPAEVERRIEQAARKLGSQLKIPGFRKGKVPPPVVIRRLGREYVLDEAVRESLGVWYVDAIDVAGIAPVGEPDINVGDLPGTGAPLAFSIEIGVRPIAKLGAYKGIEVERREPAADDATIDAEVERLRERLATLETVDRAAEVGDHVVMDYLGKLDGEPFPGGEGRDQLLELGSGRLIPGFEEQLIGAKAGDERLVEVSFPDEYSAEELAGKPATFDVTVSEVKTKRLPELDDDFASDAAGFDTLAELREDIATRIKEQEEHNIEHEFERDILDAVAAGSKIEVPHPLVHARAHEMVEETMSSLGRQGISKEMYLQISGQSEEEMAHGAEEEAEKTLRARGGDCRGCRGREDRAERRGCARGAAADRRAREDVARETAHAPGVRRPRRAAAGRARQPQGCRVAGRAGEARGAEDCGGREAGQGWEVAGQAGRRHQEEAGR